MSGLAASASAAPALSSWSSLATSRFTPVAGPAPSFRTQACGLRCWIAAKLKLRKALKRHHGWQLQRNLDARGNDKVPHYLEAASLIEKRSHWNMHLAYDSGGEMVNTSSDTLDSSTDQEKSVPQGHIPSEISSPVQKEESAVPRRHSNNEPSLCIAVIGVTGELARTKVFPALFALYYSGFLPRNVGIFGYSRKKLTDEGLRSIIEANLTCRVDHHENCDDKLSEFLKRTYYVDAGHDNKEGMVRLNSRMEQIEGIGAANRIFYLAVPQEALLHVALPLADGAQTKLGWNRIIIEKPFGFTGLSSQQVTQSMLSRFDEKQIYRYFGNYGIIRDIVHSHILQTIALFAMEPPVSLDGEDIRDEKVKVLKSIRKVELEDVVLGQLKDTSGKVDRYTKSMTPTYFAAAMYIDNARWDGVPFFIRTGMGLMKNRYIR
ncbi:inactive glucose-6-phosphate 1-dehydrogenase 4, chloroplastic-like isoform X5 [Miscanthus floridulus]|uniref:inactive glucose-6-phosphate 1-dehydrogenase 4, chloroplastic-like isoform X5 n=1 Tax=Miscanthus floridulus TaxID=154761 RepID=UPI00345A7B98